MTDSLPLGVSCSVVSDSLQFMDCSPPGSSVCEILQARILEWVAISYSRGSSSKEWTCISCITGWYFTIWVSREAPFLFVNLQSDHAGKITSKGLFGEVRSPAFNGKMMKTMTSNLNNYLRLFPLSPFKNCHGWAESLERVLGHESTFSLDCWLSD